MRILINGLPLFSKRLAEDLQEFDSTSSYYFFDTYNSKWAQIKFLLMLPFADLVISMNGVTDKSGSMDWVVRLKKKLIMQWMGTDSILARKRLKDGTIIRKYIDNAIHFVDSPWLKSELSELGLKPQEAYFKYTKKLQPVDKYTANKVFSYLAQGREEFYGIEMIINAAKTFPDVTFDLCGFNNNHYELPSNINILGWLTPSEFTKYVRESSVFLRLTQHDGFSVSVIEALGTGAEVFWTFEFNQVVYIKNENEFIDKLKSTFQTIEQRGFVPNSSSINFTRENFNRTTVIKKYIQKLHSI